MNEAPVDITHRVVDEETLAHIPPAPRSVEETGIPEAFLRELLMKVLWVHDRSSLGELASRLGLRVGVIDELVGGLRREHLCEVEATTIQPGVQPDRTLRFRLTEAGKNAAQEALQRCRYVGPAPVPLSEYVRMVKSQKSRFRRPTVDEIRAALQHLCLNDSLVSLLGQSFFSKLTLMVYGPSGNGKTDIISSLARVVDGNVAIPYTVFVQGQIIRVFDPDAHELLAIPNGESSLEGLQVGESSTRFDRRWVPVRRPAVITGGDMGSEALEMTYDVTLGLYNAPLSVVAQGGVLMIDDLGRQRISHEEILNRWVIMMENGYDSFALNTGELIRMPLDVTLVFSTNLTITDLMDEAFLRRIAYKIGVPSPDRVQVAEITRRFCAGKDIAWSEEGVTYLTERLFTPGMPETRGCYPRDIVTIILDEADFLQRPAALSHEAIETALFVYLGSEALPSAHAA